MLAIRDQLADFAADVKGLFVGERTFGDAAVPPIVFVLTQQRLGVNGAAVAALVVAAVFVVVRWRRRSSATYALGGVATVAVAVLFALRSGDAEDFFIPGIASAFFWAAVGALSIAVKRPFLIFASAFYRGWPAGWYRRDDVRPAYTIVSTWWVGYLLMRGVGQLWLYLDDRIELLLTYKLATSWPVSLPLLFAGYVYGNRKLHRLGGPSVAEFSAGAQPPFAGGQHGF